MHHHGTKHANEKYQPYGSFVFDQEITHIPLRQKIGASGCSVIIS
jgi:hypothetical protein